MKFFYLCLFFPAIILAKTPPLGEMMPLSVQKDTGVIRLKQHEKAALASWLYTNFFEERSHEKNLTVSINIDGGKKLQLSDESIWTINPSDVSITSTWISDIKVKIYPSGDTTYPYFIVNTRTNRAVKAKRSKSLDNS